MKLSKFAIAAAIAAVSISAQAQSGTTGGKGLYGEIGYASLNYKETAASLSTMGAARVILGYNLMENLAMDGMVAFGASDGSTTISGVTIKGRIDSGYGIYLKPKAKLSESIEVFGRLGYFNANMTVWVPGTPLSVSGSGGDFSYGIGGNVKVSKDMSLNLDYMSYYNKNGTTVNGVTLGLGFNF